MSRGLPSRSGLCRLGVLLLLLLAARSLAGSDVEVFLTNGEVIRGSLVEDDLDHITLRRDIPTAHAAIAVENTYYRDRILHLETLVRTDPEYDRRAQAVADTVQAHLELAQWCRDQDMIAQARTQALRAIALAPHDATATSLLIDLGCTYADGSWQELTSYLLKSGKVRYAGQIMSQGDAEILRQKAHDDQRISDLVRIIAASNLHLESVRLNLASSARERTRLPLEINATQDAIQEQKLAQSRFRAMMLDPTGPDVAAVGSATAHADLANVRSQAQDAYRLLPSLQSQLAQLHRQLQLLDIARQDLLCDRQESEATLARELAALDQLRAESAQMIVSAPVVP